MNRPIEFAPLPVIFFGLIFLNAVPLNADPPEAPTEVIHQVESAYAKATDIEAFFTQKVLFKDFDTPYISKGRVYIKKGKMRWDYHEPSKQQIFVQQEEVLYYVPEHRQVIKSALSAETDSQVPLNLLSGTAHLSETFDISVDSSSHGTYRLNLVPKDRKLHADIQIEVAPPSYLIQQITIEEKNGNRSVFDFLDIKANQGLKDETFSFVIPKGVEVVESPPVR